MTESVAEQGESALHQEGADRGRGETGEHGRDQRATHEVVVEELEHQITPSPGTPGVALVLGVVVHVGVVLVHDAVDGSVVRDRAGIEHDSAIDQLSQRPELVRDEQDGSAFFDETTQQLGEHLLVLVVDPRGGLVHDEQLRLGREGSRDQRTLLHAARKLIEGRAAAIGQADAGDGGGDRRVVGGGVAPDIRAIGQTSARDDFAYGRRHAGDGARALRYVAQASTLAEVSQGSAEQLNGSPLIGTSPMAARTSVDLPEPLDPSSATNSPSPTSRSTPRRTSRPSKETVTPCATRGFVIDSRSPSAGLRGSSPSASRRSRPSCRLTVPRWGRA